MANNEQLKSQGKTENVAQPAKQNSQNNKKNKKVKENKPSRVAKTVSELKKVSWPTFKDVVKQTSVVLVVVLAFLLVILGLDRLCMWLVGLMM